MSAIEKYRAEGPPVLTDVGNDHHDIERERNVLKRDKATIGRWLIEAMESGVAK